MEKISRIEESSPHQDEVVVLGKFVDGLSLSIDGVISPSFVETLNNTKERVRTLGREAPSLVIPGLPGGPLQPRYSSRGNYDLDFDNQCVYIAITQRPPCPALVIQFKAHILYIHTLEEIETIVEDLARFIFEFEFKVLVSRFDIAVDFQGGERWEPPTAEMLENDIISRVDEPHVVHRNVEGKTQPGCMTFGKPGCPLQVQIYDKTEELKKSGKQWMYDVWREGEQFTEGLEVWRVESRFFRKKLRELGVNTISDLRHRMGNLMQAVVGNDKGAHSWIRVASPDTRGRRQDRRPAGPWWEEIRKAFLDGTPPVLPLQKPPNLEPNIKHTENMLFGYLDRWMAQGGGEGLNPETPLEEFLDLLEERYSNRLQFKGTSLPRAIRAKRADMGLPSLNLMAP